MEKIKNRSEIKMGEKTYHRFDISDAEWELLEAHMTGQPGQHGGIAKDNRKFINAVIWILKTGSPWRDLPPDYGKWGTVHQRFIRWQRKGMWKKLFEILKDDKNFEWLMIDSSYVKIQLELAAGIKLYQRQKGAQFENTLSRQWAWHACKIYRYRGNACRL